MSWLKFGVFRSRSFKVCMTTSSSLFLILVLDRPSLVLYVPSLCSVSILSFRLLSVFLFWCHLSWRLVKLATMFEVHWLLWPSNLFFFPSHLCSFMAELVMLPIDWLAVRLIDLHSRRAGHWWMAVTVPGPSSEQRRLLRLLLTSLVLLYFSPPCLVYNSCLLITRCHLYPFTYSLQLSLHPSILLPSPAVCSPLMPPTFFNAIENQCWG